MNTYHDRYARFGVLIGILVGVAIIAIIGLVSSCPDSEDTAYSSPQVQPMVIHELSAGGYIGCTNENQDWCDQFFDFTNDDIEVSGQVSATHIEIFIRDTSTGVMARIDGDNVSNLEMEVK